MWSVHRPAPDSHTGQAQSGTARCCDHRRFPASATVNSASAIQIVEYSAASISASGLPHRTTRLRASLSERREKDVHRPESLLVRAELFEVFGAFLQYD